MIDDNTLIMAAGVVATLFLTFGGIVIHYLISIEHRLTRVETLLNGHSKGHGEVKG